MKICCTAPREFTSFLDQFSAARNKVKIMISKKVDYNLEKAEIVQLTNDAYYYLAFDEPCLDDENMDEVKEFKERFPYGFKFNPGIEPVEGTDLIECTVIPICECNTPYTHYKVMNKWFKNEFYYSEDKKRACYRIYNMYNGFFVDLGWSDVIINKFGKPEIHAKKCILPLWGKNWMTY